MKRQEIERELAELRKREATLLEALEGPRQVRADDPLALGENMQAIIEGRCVVVPVEPDTHELRADEVRASDAAGLEKHFEEIRTGKMRVVPG